MLKVKTERVKFFVDRVLNALSTLFATLMTFLGLMEYYTVAIKQDIEQYPFGSECAPDHYETSELYANVVLMNAILFGVLLFFQAVNWKKSFLSGFWILGLTLFTILIEKLLLSFIL